jgi:hypothetical protein
LQLSVASVLGLADMPAAGAASAVQPPVGIERIVECGHEGSPVALVRQGKSNFNAKALALRQLAQDLN